VKRLVVLISGGGSNLEALLNACSDPDYGAQVVAVGADRDCAGLQHAHNHNIPTFITEVQDYPTRQDWDHALSDHVGDYRPDLVISAGFLKLVGPRFLSRFDGRFINTHNSLLPAFPGTQGPQDALDYGVKITGATLFFVDDGVDTGVIIAQVAVPVEDDDTLATLTERIKVAERAQLVDTVGRMSRHGWRIKGRACYVGRA